ncbi:hypothetical protein U9M48_013494 [Paspalum notatum var. saurae]|uniref:Uncharacterized protein n=1 Tax=Paspalum notatum var. saurae TaxID=547442 RepID=A0AAQ3SZL0_PASNO
MAWLKFFGPDIPDQPSGMWVNLGCAEDPEDAIASPPWSPPPPRQSPTPERPAKKRRVEAMLADDEECWRSYENTHKTAENMPRIKDGVHWSKWPGRPTKAA